MLRVDDYAKIRRAHRDGMSIRQIARRWNHSRKSVRKALSSPEPGKYQRRAGWAAPKFTAELKCVVDAILEADESAPRKQRHFATRLFERLRDEHGYTGGYDQIRRYVQAKRREKRETFLPLVREPGRRAECDFGHIAVDFPEGRRQVAVLLVTWSYSNAVFAIATPTERVEAVLAGLTSAMSFFGCVPGELWWDNPTTVAKEILRGRDRIPHDRYKAFCSHYTTEPLFCMPRKGNEKSSVENRVKTMQRHWATPAPRAKDLEELNRYLEGCCLRDRSRSSPRKGLTIAEAFQEERTKALPVPDVAFDPCIRQLAKADKYQTIPFDGNRYSVPRVCAFQTVTVKGYVDRIEVLRGVEVVAVHRRCHGKGEQSLDPLHYLTMLAAKPALLDHSKAYRDWKLPAVIGQLRDLFEQREGPKAGARQYIRVLELLADHPVDRIATAIRLCRQRNKLDAMSIRSEAERLRDRSCDQEPTRDSARGDLSRVRSADADLSHFNHLLVQGGTTCPIPAINS